MEFNTTPPWMENDPRFSGGIVEYDKNLNEKYNQNLEMEKLREGSIVIKLSDIPLEREEQTLIFLDEKLKEYTERFEARMEEFGKDPQPSMVKGMFSANYKRAGLKILLERGELNTWAFSNSLASLHEGIIEDRFNNAMGVIEDYVKTGGVNLKHR